MIISHKHKFIFIRNRKSGAAGIEKMLTKYLGPEDRYTTNVDDICGELGPENVFTVNGTTFSDHTGWRDIATAFPEEWNSYYKFTCERNPWDKVISYYYWVKLTSPDYVASGFEPFVFSEGIEKCCFWDNYADGSKIVVDQVMLYENLHEELAALANSGKIPYNGELYNVPIINSCNRPEKDYHEYYTPESQQRIADLFVNEINYFGFQF